MYNLIKKTRLLAEELKSKKKGELFFLGLVKRADINDKYDLLVITSWYKEKTEESDVKFIFNLLKNITDGDLSFLANIVFPSPEENFVFDIDKVSEKLELDIVNEVLLHGDFKISLIPIYVNFDNYLYKRKKIEKIKLSSF